MRRIALQEPVSMSGPNFFGLPGTIAFKPANKPGWYWETSGGAIIPISLATTNPTADFNCVTLHHKRNWLSIYEHIGALRWTGLDGVTVCGTPLPPYDGRAGDQWSELRPKADVRDDEPIGWVTGRDEVKILHHKIPDGYISFTPSSLKLLQVFIAINYPGLGSYELTWRAPTDAIDYVLNAFSQGYPSQRKHWAHALGWMHMDKVTWMDDGRPARVLYKFALHRLADLLGTLSLVTHNRLLAGTIHSYGAGHKEDLILVKEIERIGLNML